MKKTYGNTLKQINTLYYRRRMDKIINIAQTLQQERLAEEQQWNTLHKNQKTKNKLLRQQLGQTQAMNLSLERENERLWKMIAREKPLKRKHVELVDLTLDEPPIKIKKEIKIEKANIKIEMTEIEGETDKEEFSEAEPEPVSEPGDETVPEEVVKTPATKPDEEEEPEEEEPEEEEPEEEEPEEEEPEEEEPEEEEPEEEEPEEEEPEEEEPEEEEPEEEEPEEEEPEEEEPEGEEPEEEAEVEEPKSRSGRT